MQPESPGTALRTALFDLHVERGARLVPYAGYSLPVQFPDGLVAEHRHTRTAAGLFDVSHMGQILVSGAGAAQALERVMPVDVAGLGAGRQRYGLLTNDDGGILDDLMFTRRDDDFLLVVNGACKHADLAHLRTRIGSQCTVSGLLPRALLALQGPQACAALQTVLPGVERLVFMTGAAFAWNTHDVFVTRSGYTGEDGFEVSLPDGAADAFARLLLADSRVKPVGLGARNSLRLEAGLCLYGNDIDAHTTPIEAGLSWAIQKVRRPAGARSGGYPGATKIEAQLQDLALAAGQIPSNLQKKRVGLTAQERVPVREPALIEDANGAVVGQVTSGLLSPTLDQPIALAMVSTACAEPGTVLGARVRGRRVPMRVCALPFVPHRYHRG